MLEQQFIQFSETIDSASKCAPIWYNKKAAFQFFVAVYEALTTDTVTVDLVSITGGKVYAEGVATVTRCELIDSTVETGYYYHCTITKDLTSYIAQDGTFRLLIRHGYKDSDGYMTWEKIGYSNIIRMTYNEGEYLSTLQYWCNEWQFGFPFYKATGGTLLHPFTNYYRACVPIPIKISKPQYTQTDKIYEKRDGEQVVLYATIQKEYEGETDYIPDDWHEKIVTALSCDEVYIDGVRVTKSNTYEIDQENVTYDECGNRLTRATFKVKENVISRNTNY